MSSRSFAKQRKMTGCLGAGSFIDLKKFITPCTVEYYQPVFSMELSPPLGQETLPPAVQ